MEHILTCGETQTMEHILTCYLYGHTTQEDLADFNDQARRYVNTWKGLV